MAVVLTASAVPRKQGMWRITKVAIAPGVARCKAAFVNLTTSSRYSGYESFPRDESWRDMFSRLMVSTFQKTTLVSLVNEIPAAGRCTELLSR